MKKIVNNILSLDKPRERLKLYGANSLSNIELLSILLRTGNKDKKVEEISKEVLSKINNINDLSELSIDELMNVKGIKLAKACTIISALELGKRVFLINNKKEILLNNSNYIYEYFKHLFIYEKQELLYGVFLDSKNKLISYKMIFKGTLNSSTVHPREIFKEAIKASAKSIIIIHNHPSGDLTPSLVDIDFTNTMIESGKIIGIKLLDSLIISDKGYYSFYESMNKDTFKT